MNFQDSMKFAANILTKLPKHKGSYILLPDNEKQQVERWEVDHGVYRLAPEQCSDIDSSLSRRSSLLTRLLASDTVPGRTNTTLHAGRKEGFIFFQIKITKTSIYPQH